MALTQVSSAGIKNAEVKTEDILDANITTAKIAADAVTGAKIADDAVGSEHIEVLDANLQFADNAMAKFGTGNDLEIYHDGSNSYIKDIGTGLLRIATDGLKITNAAESENILQATENGAVQLYYDNSLKLETSAGGADVTGGFSVTGDVHFNSATNAGKDVYWDESASELQFSDSTYATFGTGEDLKLYHNGTNDFIQSNGGYLKIQTDSLKIHDRSDDHPMITAVNDGAVELYNDNIKTFETTAGGIRVLGPEGGAGEVAIYADEGDDNADKWKLKMDGSNVFRIQNYASGSWENAIAAVGDGAVELYYDNSKKLETKSYGVNMPDNSQLYFGNGDDLLIKHDGSNSYITNATGRLDVSSTSYLYLESNDRVYIGNVGMSEVSAIFIKDGAVSLNYDNAKKLETTSTGLKSESSSDLNIHLLKTGVQDTLIQNTGQTEICAATGGASGQRIVFRIGANTGSMPEIARFTPDGLCFGSDTAAANALDDYETGTWTPTVHDGTIGTSNARYVKIGRQVTVWALCDTFSDRTTNDEVKIGGIPFASESNGVKGSCMYRYCDESARTTIYMNSSNQMFLYGGETGNYSQVRHNELNSSSFEVYLMATYDAD